MQSTPFPPHLLKELCATGALSTLMIPGRKNAFGIAQLDVNTWDEPRFGAFLPASSLEPIDRRLLASLLLPSLNLFFTIHVVPRADMPEEVHFECLGWRYLQGVN